MSEARGPRAREEEALGVRRREIERRLAGLITPDLVDEHRRSPGGRHSPALAHVLAYLRQAPTEGKLAILSPPRELPRILRLSGVQGKPHEDLGTSTRGDGTPDGAAAHDVFVRRVEALGVTTPDDSGPGSAA